MTDEIIYGDISLDLIPAQSKSERLAGHAEAYNKLAADLDLIKAKIDYVKAQLLSDLPEEYGEWEIPLAEGGRVKISTPAKYDWDKAALAEMFKDGDLPDCISQNFTVSKAKFDAATTDLKDRLTPALTIKRGNAAIKVLKT